jgi:AcrR family transcriptional regulator
MAAGRPRAFDTDWALDQALALFWRKGYEGASLSDLTEAMGISRTSLYAAYGSKEALFGLAAQRYEAGAADYLSQALKAPTAREFVKALLQGAVDLHADKRNPKGCLVVHSALVCGDAADPVRQQLISRRLIGEEVICRRLKKAREQNDLPAGCDPADLARYIKAVIYGLAVQSVGGATRRQLQGVADMAMRFWPPHSG